MRPGTAEFFNYIARWRTQAHRRQALARVGWTITDVFPSRWVLDADGAALHIKTVLEGNRAIRSD